MRHRIVKRYHIVYAQWTNGIKFDGSIDCKGIIPLRTTKQIRDLEKSIAKSQGFDSMVITNIINLNGNCIK